MTAPEILEAVREDIADARTAFEAENTDGVVRALSAATDKLERLANNLRAEQQAA